ncbi:hypothetical protein EUX98_g9507 [Antrodiella citrinella]|uniref:ABC transmembrane type-2 domain-containing protein n=1 Tax=Antrodiella citrinella TaxID=2447956 RepID=A0A4S4LSN4_9APHY|nr:hypothetical protein EUX98_g9507 [Antrodiella citrinella]
MILVLISMLLFRRNRATNSFQHIVGIFVASCGGARRIIDVLHAMGISVSYDTVQRSLVNLSDDAKKQARAFIEKSDRLFGVVYDNINLTNRKASQRLDSTTQQINATTLAVFSFPSTFTRAAYAQALSLLERQKLAGLRQELKLKDLTPSEETQANATKAFEHAVRTLLLDHIPGKMQTKNKLRNKLKKGIKKLKPSIRVLGHERTAFFPLPALDEEEVSVGGTIRVVELIFMKLLGLAPAAIYRYLQILVGDWLTIRNLRLMKEEHSDEFTPFNRMDWVQEASMPFHFQLNAVYMLFRTHFTLASVRNAPTTLDHHRQLLKRAKLDAKKPEYNKAKELVLHSLVARVLDCARLKLKLEKVDDMKTWVPNWEEFDAVARDIVSSYTSSAAAHDALEKGDDVLAHSILFIRDALFFYEFCDAICDADVGRMWVVYDFWVFMMRGAGCHNYGNEILEMKAQYYHELPPLLRDVMERTWLVNRWGRKGRSIPTDLYLEHNNGFIKNIFAAMGSNATIKHIQDKSSACVEVLRTLAHQMTEWFGVRDPHRGHTQVPPEADIAALCLDLSVHKVHTFTPNRSLSATKARRGKKGKTPEDAATTTVSAVHDVLLDGMSMLTEKNLYIYWLKRTGMGGTDIYHEEDGEVPAGDEMGAGTAFEDPDGRMDIDTSLDPELDRDVDVSAEFLFTDTSQ